MEELQELKRSLGIDSLDTSRDVLLMDLYKRVEQALQVNLGVARIPPSLNWIILEVTIERFNRLGSEGVERQEVEGYSTTYQSGSWFEAYEPLLQDWKATQTSGDIGKVRFL